MGKYCVGDKLHVSIINRNAYEYIIIESGVTSKVNLLEYTRSGRNFNLMKISYDHVMTMTTLRLKFDDDYGKSIYEYTSSIYLVKHYKCI